MWCDMEESMFYYVIPESDNQIYERLSELDKLCIGEDGWSADSFRSEAEKENGIVLCCSSSGRMAGLICGYFAGGEADITSVAVHPDYRRKHIAECLMQIFELQIPDDTEEIFLEVRESNTPAIKLYEKCGFEKLSVRKNFYASPVENAIVMRKRMK